MSASAAPRLARTVSSSTERDRVDTHNRAGLRLASSRQQASSAAGVAPRSVASVRAVSSTTVAPTTHAIGGRSLTRPMGTQAGLSGTTRPVSTSTRAVVSSTIAAGGSTLKRLGKAILSARVRAFHVVLAIMLLVASLFGSLLLRTQMVQDSFTITQTQQNINTLTQDIQEEQVKLEKLQASLPSKASDLGMVPGSQPVTIDITQAAQQH